MLSQDLQLQISLQLNEKTNIKNWLITGPEIEARECIIYKASNDDFPHPIAIKVYRKHTKKTSLLQHDVLVRFSNTLNSANNGYFVPEVFGSLPEHGIFMMEWINAPPLERRLWRYWYSKKRVQNDIHRSFLWLKEFHTFANPNKKTVNIKRYKEILERCFKDHDDQELFSDNRIFKKGRVCFNNLITKYHNLNILHADLHGDLTPSNILINDERVTSIDMFGNNNLPVANDIALLFSYIAIEYPNMLTHSDFKLPPEEWPLLKLILDAYEYPKDSQQLHFFLFVFLYQLLRRWSIINFRNKSKRTTLLDRWRLRNTEMIVKNLCDTLEGFSK